MVSRVLRVRPGAKVIEATTDWTVFPAVLGRKVNQDETGRWVFQVCEDLLVRLGCVFIFLVHRESTDTILPVLKVGENFFREMLR